MAQLANCKSPDCGRGVERSSTTDAHGHSHPRTRVRCATCGVEGEWQDDDSLTRAIVAWNERHLPRANAIHDARAAEAREQELALRERRRAHAQGQIELMQAELAHVRIKEKDVRKAGDKGSSEIFARHAKFFEDTIAGLRAQLKELAAK